MTAYLLDANTFIQAKNGPYQFSVCPAYWEWLDREHKNGKIFSVWEIYEELAEREDDLTAWIQDRESLFLHPDEDTHSSLKLLSEWAIKSYTADAYTAFLASGDYMLVGHAIGRPFTVVTHEVAANTKNKVKIPNACQPFAVQCITPYEMLNREKASFVLG